MITFIDDFSRFMWAYFMKEKSNILMKFKDFKEKIEKEIGCKIWCLQTNIKEEYILKEFTQFLQNYGMR